MCHENMILSEIDTITRDGLSEILNLTFTDDQWLQAGLPVKDGGLGVRSVATLALPAFLASAESTDELQLRILEKTAISEDLSRDTALVSWLNETNATQPTGSASHKQKNWDNVGIELRKKRVIGQLPQRPGSGKDPSLSSSTRRCVAQCPSDFNMWAQNEQ